MKLHGCLVLFRFVLPRIHDQHLMPFGKGTVNFQKVFAALKKQGYDGLYNYEIPGERSIPLELRAIKLEYIKKAFQWMCENYKNF